MLLTGIARAIDPLSERARSPWRQNDDKGIHRLPWSATSAYGELFGGTRSECRQISRRKRRWEVEVNDKITPSHIKISEADILDLATRLARSRWPEREMVTDWSQGAPLDYLKDLQGARSSLRSALQNPYELSVRCRGDAAAHGREDLKSQVKADYEVRGRTSPEVLDGSDGAHNPKVGGSNPPPATNETCRPGPIRAGRPFCCPHPPSSCRWAQVRL